MTDTKPSIDSRSQLVGWLGGLGAMTAADIAAISDKQWTKNYGGCTRSAGALIADTVNNLRWTTAVLRDEDASSFREIGELASQYNDRSAATAGLQHAIDAFAAAYMSASEDKLMSEVMAPWQMMTPVWMLCQIAVSHVWYHDGQLNFIQCLNGDGDIHWMAAH